MKTSEVLTKAKALIDQPEKWCQGSSHVDVLGQSVPWEDAVRHCSVGSLVAAAGRRSDPRVQKAAGLLAKVIGGHSWRPTYEVAMWQDDPYRKHKEVMDAFDKAIRLAEEGGD